MITSVLIRGFMSTFRLGWMITKVLAHAHHNSLIFVMAQKSITQWTVYERVSRRVDRPKSFSSSSPLWPMARSIKVALGNGPALENEKNPHTWRSRHRGPFRDRHETSSTKGSVTPLRADGRGRGRSAGPDPHHDPPGRPEHTDAPHPEA